MITNGMYVRTLKPSFLMANITSIMYCTLTSSLPSLRMPLKLSYTPAEDISIQCKDQHTYTIFGISLKIKATLELA